MLLDGKQAQFCCIYSPTRPERKGILASIGLPISWKRVKGSPGYITEENIEEIANLLISKLQNNLVAALLADCGGDFASFVTKALKLIYGPIPFGVVKKD